MLIFALGQRKTFSVFSKQTSDLMNSSTIVIYNSYVILELKCTFCKYGSKVVNYDHRAYVDKDE